MPTSIDMHHCRRIIPQLLTYSLTLQIGRGNNREEVEVGLFFAAKDKLIAQEYFDAIQAVNRRHPELFTEGELEEMGLGVEAEAAGGES